MICTLSIGQLTSGKERAANALNNFQDPVLKSENKSDHFSFELKNRVEK